MSFAPSHALISRAAHQLACNQTHTQKAATEAAREIQSETGLTIRSMAPEILAESRRIADVRRQRLAARKMAPNAERAKLCGLFQEEIDWDAYLARSLRNVAGCDAHDSVAVEVVWGTQAPAQKGSTYVKYHWRNCGASGTVYHPSTRRVEVGLGWLVVHLPVLLAAQAA